MPKTALTEDWKSLVKYIATVDWLIAVPSGLVFAHRGFSPIVHAGWLVGLSLMFFAAVLLLIVLSLFRNNWREKTLEGATAFILAAALIGAVIMGAIYAVYLGFDKEVAAIRLH